MRLAKLPICSPLPRRIGLLRLSLPALFAVTLGCAEFHGSSEPVAGPIVRGSQHQPDQLPRVLPPPNAVQQRRELSQPVPETKPPPRIEPANKDSSKALPLDLETVFRLAETQNGQAAIAREKLRQAYATHDLAAKSWLPDIWIGTGYYRHEGGIADFEGNLITSSYGSMFSGLELNGRFDIRDLVYKKVQAARGVWQQKAEVSKLSAEGLLDAASAYVDLLAARAAEAVAVKMETNLNDLLRQANALAKSLPTAETDVARIQADINGQQQLSRKFREAAVVAGAKLIYALGLDPATELAIMDRTLAAITIVNADAPGEDLVAQAEANGPAIREMDCLVQLIQDANCQASGCARLMPVLDVRMAEGGFGTGPGSQMDWSNRWDFGVQLRWNLTDCLTSRDQQRLRYAQAAQAQLTYHDLRAKLTMGVQESREAIHSGRDQMEIGLRQVKHATDAYDRSNSRLNSAAIKDRSPSEVLLAIRTLNASNLAYLLAIRDHDKAQIRLAILTGAIGGRIEH